MTNPSFFVVLSYKQAHPNTTTLIIFNYPLLTTYTDQSHLGCRH